MLLLFTAFSISYVPLINPIVVSEDGGTVELLRIEKQGQTEIPVDVTFSGGVNECVFCMFIECVYM